MSRRLRIAWFSPLNLSSTPSASVVAYCSGLLLPLLRERFEIELFHNSYEKHPQFPTAHYLTAFERHKAQPFDLFFYQLEDAPATSFCRMHCGLVPGVLWFHDYLLTNDGPEPYLNSPWQENVARFRDLRRAWPDRTAEYKREGPYALREGGASAVALFSCPRMHDEFQSLGGELLRADSAPQRRSWYVPHPVAESEFRSPSVRADVIAMCGSPRIEHRAHKFLQALLEFQQQQMRPWKLRWMLAAEEIPWGKALCEEFELANVEFISGRSPDGWRELVQSASIAVHTLFSVYGQTGPYLNISMMQGVPSIVNDFGGLEYVPDNAVWKVTPGEGEVAQYREVLRMLAAGEGIQGAEHAWAVAREINSAPAVAAELSAVFEQVLPSVQRVMNHWKQLEAQARLVSIVDALPPVDEVQMPLRKKVRAIFDELGWRGGLR